MDDFESKLTELHDRVIGNALSDEERANYSESLFDSINTKLKRVKNFGMRVSYKSPQNINNGVDSAQ